MLDHKASLNKFKKIKIIPSIFCNHNDMKLEINQSQEKMGKTTKMWRLNNMLLNNQWAIKEIKVEIKKYLETNENRNMTYQNLWVEAKAVLRGKFTALLAYLKKPGQFQINNLNLHVKGLEKEEQMKPKISRRKEIIKIRVEIYEK